LNEPHTNFVVGGFPDQKPRIDTRNRRLIPWKDVDSEQDGKVPTGRGPRNPCPVHAPWPLQNRRANILPPLPLRNCQLPPPWVHPPNTIKPAGRVKRHGGRMSILKISKRNWRAFARRSAHLGAGFYRLKILSKLECHPQADPTEEDRRRSVYSRYQRR